MVCQGSALLLPRQPLPLLPLPFLGLHLLFLLQSEAGLPFADAAVVVACFRLGFFRKVPVNFTTA